MRYRLQKFTEFANALLPLETRYLLNNQQLVDEERLSILKRVYHNTHQLFDFVPYDECIDKRKYNHLKNWIQNKLEKIDVDLQLQRILDWEQKIFLDQIKPSNEKILLREIKNQNPASFYFSKFYEILRSYRSFLLIRLRYGDHEMVSSFLRKHEPGYSRAQKIKQNLHKATNDIVMQYSGQNKESKQWENWLLEIFHDGQVEGQLRYQALVCLAFIGYNYRKYDLLEPCFEQFEIEVEKGMMYSRRHLNNYYNNRLLLHSHKKEYKKAAYYGYMAVRQVNHDYLLYVNNLCAVLIRLKEHKRALELLKKAKPQAVKTKNMHNRIGFVAFYMECLIKNNYSARACSYGNAFLKAYQKEILKLRWHLFFSVYLEALVSENRWREVIQIIRKYDLLEKEKAYRTKASHAPLLSQYYRRACDVLALS